MAFGDRFFFMKNGGIRYSGGAECFTTDVIQDIFDIEVKMLEIENQKVILGGSHR